MEDNIGNDAVVAAVARNLRSLRSARGWSQDVLSGRSGVSKGVLVALEQGRGNPSLGTLCRLADAFGTTLTSLIGTDDEPAVAVVEGDRAPVLWRGEAGGTGVLLAGIETAGLEVWRWRMEPGEVHSSDAHAAGTLELAVVVDGVLRLGHDGEAVDVPAGSAVRFRSDRPHSYAPADEGTLLFTLVVVVAP